jgi:hypothetical protein
VVRSLAALVCCAAAIAAMAPAGAAVAPMTSDRIADAFAAGRAAASERDLFFFDVARTPAKFGRHAYDVTIITPFAVAAHAAFQAKTASREARPGDVALAPVESQSVIVTVDPAATTSSRPVAVGAAFLRRAGRVTEALRVDRHEVRFPRPSAADLVLRGSTLYFPLEPFAQAGTDLEIVVVPEGMSEEAAAVLKLETKDLASLE